MPVLVTGGAGYIGSHMVWTFLDRGERVVVLDDLSTGIRHAVPGGAIFVKGDAGNGALVSRLIAEHGVDAILHFAGSIAVPESVEKPLAYYANNTGVSRNLIEASVTCGVKHFIFSSTATVYDGKVPASPVPLRETHPTNPANPYGRSKLMTEWILEDTAKAHDFRYVILRYFNVAGADPNGRAGQSSPRATHLIKRACQAALGRLTHLDIFGTDYPTPDGTGVRDYIHVSDLVTAHAGALDYLRTGGPAIAMNCGYGHGASVRDIVAVVERVTGRALCVREGPRRAGDIPWSVADPRLIKETLGWTPAHDDLDEIVRSAYEWERRLLAEQNA